LTIGDTSRGREKLSSLLDAGKNDNGNPIDDETRAYMIYAFTESGDSDVTILMSCTASATTSVIWASAIALALQERKDARAQEVAKLIEGSAQQDEFEAHWQTARVNDYGRDVYLDAEANVAFVEGVVAD
jgi:hypothetical protein